MKTPFKKRGISLGPLNGFIPTRIGNRTESKRDTDSVSKSKQDTDSVTGEFSPARSSTAGERVSPPLGVRVSFVQKGEFLLSTGGVSKEKTSLVDEFSLPLYRRRDDRNFFFCGDDDELVTGAVTGASVREVFDRVFSRVS